jgi:hypothetical protein
VTALSQSPFTLKQQAVRHSGQRWEADIDLPPMSRSQAAVWLGWMASLRGTWGTFTMGPPGVTAPLGSAGGTPLVNGADQLGSELILDGATATQTGWLKAGDYVQLGSGSTASLKMVLQDADSDGSGNVTLDLWPDVRTAPADNDAITTTSPIGLWRLLSNDFSYDVNSASHYGIKFSAVEVIV